MATQVQFAKNLTTKEALESDNPGVIYFTKDDNSIVMGGKEYGKDPIPSQNKEYLDDLYKKETINIIAYPSKKVVNFGEEVKITVKVSNSGVRCSADSLPEANAFLSRVKFSSSGLGV